MGLLEPERRRAGLRGRELKGPPETLQTHRVRMNLRPGSLSASSCAIRAARVLRPLADDRVLHDGVAEVIDHRRDGEDAAEPLVQALVRRGLLGLGVSGISPRQSRRGGGQRKPHDRPFACSWKSSEPLPLGASISRGLKGISA